MLKALGQFQVTAIQRTQVKGFPGELSAKGKLSHNTQRLIPCTRWSRRYVVSEVCIPLERGPLEPDVPRESSLREGGVLRERGLVEVGVLRERGLGKHTT